MFKFNKQIEGKWFEIVSWGHTSNMIQLNSEDDGVIWLPDDPKQAAELLRKAADIIEKELVPVIENYKKAI
jgi:hypothetical protein